MKITKGFSRAWKWRAKTRQNAKERKLWKRIASKRRRTGRVRRFVTERDVV